MKAKVCFFCCRELQIPKKRKPVQDLYLTIEISDALLLEMVLEIRIGYPLKVLKSGSIPQHLDKGFGLF